jgi:glycosyltransferase involved in cell wall biosynthesis
MTGSPGWEPSSPRLGRPSRLRLLSLYPTFWPRQGGGQMVLAAIAEGLSSRLANQVLTRRFSNTGIRKEYEFLTVHYFWNPAPEVWKDYAMGIRPVSFPKKLVVTGLDIVCVLPMLRRLALESDLVHLHFPLPLGISALLVRPLVRRPLIVTVHGNADVYELPPLLAPVTRAVLTRADTVVSVGRDLAEYLRSSMGVSNVTVIPNGIPVSTFQMSHSTGPALSLLSICRIVPRKNIPVLIDAVERLVGEGHQLSLVIAGTGSEEEAIAHRVARASSAIRFVGFIDEAEKRRLLMNADVFVQLSTREGLSIAALEALASGVPCVVSDLPGVREPIDAGVTGWYVERPDDVDSVTAALRRVIADRERLPEMRRACRTVAEQRYSYEAMCESYWNVFTSALGSRP